LRVINSFGERPARTHLDRILACNGPNCGFGVAVIGSNVVCVPVRTISSRPLSQMLIDEDRQETAITRHSREPAEWPVTATFRSLGSRSRVHGAHATLLCCFSIAVLACNGTKAMSSVPIVRKRSPRFPEFARMGASSICAGPNVHGLSSSLPARRSSSTQTLFKHRTSDDR
jgi:hypothetical protein